MDYYYNQDRYDPKFDRLMYIKKEKNTEEIHGKKLNKEELRRQKFHKKVLRYKKTKAKLLEVLKKLHAKENKSLRLKLLKIFHEIMLKWHSIHSITVYMPSRPYGEGERRKIKIKFKSSRPFVHLLNKHMNHVVNRYGSNTWEFKEETINIAKAIGCFDKNKFEAMQLAINDGLSYARDAYKDPQERRNAISRNFQMFFNMISELDRKITEKEVTMGVEYQIIDTNAIKNTHDDVKNTHDDMNKSLLSGISSVIHSDKNSNIDDVLNSIHLSELDESALQNQDSFLQYKIERAILGHIHNTRTIPKHSSSMHNP